MKKLLLAGIAALLLATGAAHATEGDFNCVKQGIRPRKRRFYSHSLRQLLAKAAIAASRVAA